MSAADRRKRHEAADRARVELAAFVKHYKAHNDRFAQQLDERHARWAARGLLTSPPITPAGLVAARERAT